MSLRTEMQRSQTSFKSIKVGVLANLLTGSGEEREIATGHDFLSGLEIRLADDFC